jgi:uncharacterized membrane protein YjgN (DUF898 family)
MKNYLSFHLDGKSLFPYWISTYLLGIVLVVIYYMRSRAILAGDMSFGTSMIILLTLLILIVVIYVFYYYLIRYTTENIEYNGEKLVPSYTIIEFLGMFCLGTFLSIITIGIYLPWFIRNLYAFFIDGTSYKGTRFRFDGDGLTLFGIFTLLMVIPMIAISFIAMALYGEGNVEGAMMMNVYQLIVLPPFYTLLFKWKINGGYNGYRIGLKVNFMQLTGYIFIQLLLSIVTIGIYLPLAYLNLYKYVLAHVDCVNEAGEKVALDYDIERGADFLFIWGQLLLTIVTLGVYLPWAYAKVMCRILPKTSLE